MDQLFSVKTPMIRNLNCPCSFKRSANGGYVSKVRPDVENPVSAPLPHRGD